MSDAGAARLPRALIPIYGITFIDVLGYTIVIPLLPFFAERYGMRGAAVGLLLTANALAAAVSSPIWGSLSDRLGRKPALLISQLFSIAGFVVLIVAPNAAWVVASRVIAGLGGGNVGVAQSYIADVTTEEQRPRAYAWNSALFGAGFVLGPVMGGTLHGLGVVAPFVAALLLAATNLAVTLRFLHHAARRPATGASGRDLVGVIAAPRVANLLGRQFVYIFAYTYLFTTFSLFLQRMLHADPTLSSYLLGFAGIVGAVTMVVATDRLVGRFGATRVAQTAFAVSLIAYCTLPLATSVWRFIAFLVPWSAAGAALRPTLTALLSDAAPDDARGGILGVNDTLNSLAMVITPVLGAWVVTAAPHLIGVAPALASLLGLALGAGAANSDRRAARRSAA